MRCTRACPALVEPGSGWPTTPTGTTYSGDLPGALRGADVFIGVSAPNLLTGDDIAGMAPNAIVFALANPDPEVDPREARKHAAVVATGRSDQPNQINNVLAFPGVFRGMLDAGARAFTEEMALAAAKAIADAVGREAQPVGDRAERLRPQRGTRRRRGGPGGGQGPRVRKVPLLTLRA